MRAFRHPKQRFDENADFVYRKRLRMGGEDPEKAYVNPGDPVDKAAFRPGLLKRWWRAGIIELADWTPPERGRVLAVRASASLSDAGGGWWLLSIAGARDERLRGREAARARCEELGIDFDRMSRGHACAIPGKAPQEAQAAAEKKTTPEPEEDSEGAGDDGGDASEPETQDPAPVEAPTPSGS